MGWNERIEGCFSEKIEEISGTIKDKKFRALKQDRGRT